MKLENIDLRAYPGSEKTYMKGERFPELRVGMRQVNLTPTVKIDADGNKVSLTQIDFVKVYTAISQNCGWVGETSTEICGGEDLHPDIEVSINNISVPALRHTDACYDMYGRPVSDPSAPGIYIRMTAGGYEKVLVR